MSYRSSTMASLMRGGVTGPGDGVPASGAANPASVGSLRSRSHLNSLRRGMTMFGGNGSARMTKSRSFANLSGKILDTTIDIIINRLLVGQARLYCLADTPGAYAVKLYESANSRFVIASKFYL